ncbi:lipopolysaccharide export system permease protein [Humidesulfovibrio mexicanus]|uniref:Lipopolysaccharide export system permease protein n=1 Tax=Humidesulfovibrio mexicanus TaxID=147047 RepID=A0A238ZF26_9BACT|nr:LptF/LptG family permease [Humidesulfovibrio mexicanus]SNR82105.1 lipopolysaccharide export system permease protein [Humidesulfovibrio mexicanus]
MSVSLPRLGALGGYLVRQNLFLMATCLGAGVFIYLLTDLADRLEHFLDAGLGLRQTLTYFLVKMPLILSQILPAVFLLAVVLQIGIMVRSREMMALRAGGMSMGWFIRFFVVYALVWSLGQLVFSQFIASYGEREASRIWREEVRKRQLDKRVVKNLWFREGAYIVHATEAQPTQSRVNDVTVYEFDTDSQRLERIMTAKKGLVDEHGWGLLDVWEIETRDFMSSKLLTSFIPLRQDMRSFLNADVADRSELPLWRLGQVIDELRESGSNVERLRTAWHGKWSYAFSIVVMALLALALCSFFENLYVNMVLSLLVVFSYYGLYVLGITTGQKGLLPPVAGAWLANTAFGLLAGMRLAWICAPRFAARARRWREGVARRLSRSEA